MSKPYYVAEDLKKFGKIGDFHEEYANKFFEYYNSVMAEGELTAREKALIALAVSHAHQCPYCIDAYSTACVEQGVSEGQMMEAVHVAATMVAGVKLAHSVQMMNKVREITM